MNDKITTPADEYDYVHGTNIFNVRVFYSGKGTLVDIIKDSLKRDFELMENNENSE
jgi:hypothetical protein